MFCLEVVWKGQEEHLTSNATLGADSGSEGRLDPKLRTFQHWEMQQFCDIGKEWVIGCSAA